MSSVQSSREIVSRALTFSRPERVPRDLWLLPWASLHHEAAVRELKTRFPSDFDAAPRVYRPSARVQGSAYVPGIYVDEWGCRFRNLQEGIIGEVFDPLVKDLSAWNLVRPPWEILPADPGPSYELLRRFRASNDRFITADCLPRPWERYQFLRGTENALLDLLVDEVGARGRLGLIHQYYLREVEFWSRADVDAIVISDDWGSQNQLLIDPGLWRRIFKPLYREYCDIARSQGKFILLHSDGHISSIFEDLIEVGFHAVNSQLFCMNIEELGARYQGRITFWGEIDRQHILPSPNPEVGRAAVRRVARSLYRPEGGVIAQFELGPGGNPSTAMAIFDEWRRIDEEQVD
jgi:hypothetical protein